HIRDRLGRGGIGPHAAAAGGRTEWRGMDGDDGAQPRAVVVTEDDLLVAVEFAHVEDFHESASDPDAGRREILRNSVPAGSCKKRHKSCESSAIGGTLLSLNRSIVG